MCAHLLNVACGRMHIGSTCEWGALHRQNNAWILYESSNDVRACVRRKRACSNEIDVTETTYASFNNFVLNVNIKKLSKYMIIICNKLHSLTLTFFPIYSAGWLFELTPDNEIRFPLLLAFKHTLCTLCTHPQPRYHINAKQWTNTQMQNGRRKWWMCVSLFCQIIITYIYWERTLHSNTQHVSKFYRKSGADNEEIMCS